MADDALQGMIAGAQSGNQMGANAAQWAFQSADIGIKKQYLQQAQEQHQLMRDQFESQVAQQSIGQFVSIAKMPKGATKDASIGSLREYGQRIGNPYSEVALATLKDDGRIPDWAKIGQGITDPKILSSVTPAMWKDVHSSLGDDGFPAFMDKMISGIGTAQSGLNRGQQQSGPRNDANARAAVQDIENSKNMVNYRDLQNGLGDALFNLSPNNLVDSTTGQQRKPSIVEQNEALQKIQSFYARSNNPTDSRAAQTQMKTAEKTLATLLSDYGSDVYVEGPDNITKMLTELGEKGLQSVGDDIKREARTQAEPLLLGTKDPDVRALIKSRLDYYNANKHMEDLRAAKNLGQAPSYSKKPGQEKLNAAIAEAKQYFDAYQKGTFINSKGVEEKWPAAHMAQLKAQFNAFGPEIRKQIGEIK